MTESEWKSSIEPDEMRQFINSTRANVAFQPQQLLTGDLPCFLAGPGNLDHLHIMKHRRIVASNRQQPSVLDLTIIIDVEVAEIGPVFRYHLAVQKRLDSFAANLHHRRVSLAGHERH